MGELIRGVRSAGFPTLSQKLMPLIINSLLETNLGMPYIYLIFIGVTSRYQENFRKRKKSLHFTDRIAENNEVSVRF